MSQSLSKTLIHSTFQEEFRPLLKAYEVAFDETCLMDVRAGLPRLQRVLRKGVS
ncbi:hypothetical protein SBV1_2530001 [Verrucomicrobia bacterium]|nr:hypothetical protein SBV1_2530001 [Verrucomicrobiota bacterium]